MDERILQFLREKGVDTSGLNEESLLMHYIQSADFMELIVTIEMQLGRELDLESADIEQISSLGGFTRWLEQSQQEPV